MILKKHWILSEIGKAGVVAVIRANSVEQGANLSRAVYLGGIPAVEITMTVPGAVDILSQMSVEKDGPILGAGTVLDPETARICILAGASFIVSPNMNEDVIKTCNRYGIPCMPGVGTVSEAVKAMELGVDVVKAFPGEVLGPGFIKAIKGPLPHAQVMPTGGVSISNLKQWLDAGAFAVGMGGALTKPGGIEGDMDLVTATAKEIMKTISDVRSNRI